MTSYRVFQSIRPNMLKILYSKPQLKPYPKLSDFVFTPFPNKCVKTLPVVTHKIVRSK